MASFGDLRDAIVAVLDTELADTHLYGLVPERANLPAIVVQPAEATFPFTNARATDEFEFDLVVMTSPADMGLGQSRLDAYLSGEGATSIRQIFMRHRRLDRDDVLAAYVAGMSDYGSAFGMAGIDNVGCRLRVIVQANGPGWS